MNNSKRPLSFWFIMTFLVVSLVLLFMGQTMAILNYEFAVSLGLQEDVKVVGEFGKQINRAFGASDTIIYIPFIILSMIGLFLKKRWSLMTTAAVMGISAYWSTTVAFLFWFLIGVPNYHFIPGPEYWVFIAIYLVFGVWGMFYLIFRGEKLIS